MITIYLGLGANVGNAADQIEVAIKLLGEQVGAIRQAPIYETRPFGLTDQPNFLNTAIAGTTTLTPQALRDFVKGIERQLGRKPAERYGPREIDIDILLYGDRVIEEDRLVIPHLSISERDFVLQPLLDLEPELTCPRTGRCLADYLREIPSLERYIERRLVASHTIKLQTVLPLAQVIQKHDVVVIGNVLSDGLLRACLKTAQALPFAEQAKEYGRRKVKQEVWSARVERGSLLDAVATTLGFLVEKKVGKGYFRPGLEFTSRNIQRYADGSHGIDPHQDHPDNRNLVGLLTLAGSAVFAVYDELGTSPRMRYSLEPNSLLLMKAPGFYGFGGSEACPVHGVSDIVGGEDGWRYLLGLRQNDQIGA